MDPIRFEPSVSATFAIDRNPSGNGGDLFADMLGDHMKKRAAADRPEPLTRRKPQNDRPLHEEDRPAARRPGVVIKHAHEFNDTATTARDVTPNREVQPTLPAPARDRPACMDDHAPTGTAEDKDQQTGQEEPVLASTELAADAPAEATDQVIVIAVDPQTPILNQAQASIDDQAPAVAEAPEAAVAIPPAGSAQVAPAAAPATDADTPPEAAAVPATDAAVQPEAPAEQANFAAALAASLGDTMAGLVSNDAALDVAASVETLASVSMTTLATPKAATPPATDAPQAAAIELAATITPEAPRPAAEIKARPAVRAAPAAEIKAQAAAAQGQTPMPQPPVAAQALAHAAPNAAFSEAIGDEFDAGFGADGVGTPGWTLHLAQGAAAKRPDFIAQLRQHLQELPAHEQVAVNIQRALREGSNRLTIQLSPAELGKIHVKLEIDEEKRVTAAVTVEKPSTLELLQRDVKGLERALQEAGLKMDGNDLSFNLGRQDSKEFSQETRQSGTAGFGNGAGEAPAEGDVPAGQAATLVDTAAGLVNVQI